MILVLEKAIKAGHILHLFERLAKQGKTVLIVRHDPSISQRTDQTLVLSDGEVIDRRTRAENESIRGLHQ